MASDEPLMADDWRDQLFARVDDFFETKLGPDIAADMRTHAPRDTGYLAAHIDHHVDTAEHNLAVTADTDYAAAVENGHVVVSHGRLTDVYVAPQPFMRPALYRKRRYPQ